MRHAKDRQTERQRERERRDHPGGVVSRLLREREII